MIFHLHFAEGVKKFGNIVRLSYDFDLVLLLKLEDPFLSLVTNLLVLNNIDINYFIIDLLDLLGILSFPHHQNPLSFLIPA